MRRGHVVCVRWRARIPNGAQGGALRHHIRLFHAEWRRALPAVQIAWHASDRAYSGLRDERTAARRADRAEPEARDFRSTRGRADFQESVRYQGALRSAAKNM